MRIRGKSPLIAAAAWALRIPAAGAAVVDAAGCVAGADFPSCLPTRVAILRGPEPEVWEGSEYVQLLQQGMLVSRADRGAAAASDAVLQAARPSGRPAPAPTPPRRARAAARTVPTLKQATEAATRPVSALTVLRQQADAALGAAAETGRTTARLRKLGRVWTAVDVPGLPADAERDLDAFAAGLLYNGVTCIVCLAILGALRARRPETHSKGVLKGTPPGPKPDHSVSFSCFQATDYALEEAIDSAGLDHVMLLEFSQLCMRILAMVGLPTCLIVAPLHVALGGGEAGGDLLSYTSAFVVWGVVFCVGTSVCTAQGRFLQLRFTWLRRMADLQANTVLVEGIPVEHQSDAALREFLETVFPGDRMTSVYVAKVTGGLASAAAQLELARRLLREAEAADKQHPGKPLAARGAATGAGVRAVDRWAGEVERLEPAVDELRKQVKEQAAARTGPEGGNTSSGFVTFKRRCDAEFALRLDGVSSDDREFVVSAPPAPDDVLWADLARCPAGQGLAVKGYLALAGLYLAYLPLVVGVTNVGKSIRMGSLQPLWAGVAPALGLTIVVSFLPTLLRMILESFFNVKAAAWAQHRLQIWYFWFQVVLILVAAVGQDVPGFASVLLAEPMEPILVFRKLFRTVPLAAHFYMSYLALQCSAHAIHAIRCTSLTKRLGLRDGQAALAEPEDQDYSCGVGARSSRWTVDMLVGIVFGTLCPAVNLLCLLNFAVARLVHGRLVHRAEARKSDLGGAFWCSKLTHLFYGSAIYVVLMSGVLLESAAGAGPALVASTSLLYVFWSHLRFQSFKWERLPFQELVKPEEPSEPPAKRDARGKYMQPELYPEALS